MKKIRFLLLALFVAVATPLCVSAKSFTFDDITYELDDNYKYTTKENLDTSGYRPLQYKEEEFKELLNSGQYSLFGFYDIKDSFSINFKVKKVNECGNIASKKDIDKCMSSASEELKSRENTDLVDENKFTSKNGVNYYTLKYFKFGGTYLEVITSYNDIAYTFTFATSYSQDDIDSGAKKIMDSVSLNGFKATVDEQVSKSENNNDKVTEEKDNNILVIGGIVAAIVVIGGISIFIFKKK